MFKRLLSVLLVCFLVFAMATGCGRSASGADSDEPEISASGKADPDEKAPGKDTKIKDDDTGSMIDEKSEDTGSINAKESEAEIKPAKERDTGEDEGSTEEQESPELELEFEAEAEAEGEADVGSEDSSFNSSPAAGGFTVTIVAPEGWKKLQVPYELILLYYEKNVNQSVPPAFSVFLPYGETHSTTEEEAQYFAEQVKAAYPDNSQIGQIMQTTIDGLDAHRVDVVYPLFGDMKKEIEVFFIKNGQMIVAAGGCSVDDDESIREIEAMLKSLRIR